MQAGRTERTTPEQQTSSEIRERIEDLSRNIERFVEFGLTSIQRGIDGYHHTTETFEAAFSSLNINDPQRELPELDPHFEFLRSSGQREGVIPNRTRSMLIVTARHYFRYMSINCRERNHLRTLLVDGESFR